MTAGPPSAKSTAGVGWAVWLSGLLVVAGSIYFQRFPPPSIVVASALGVLLYAAEKWLRHVRSEKRR